MRGSQIRLLLYGIGFVLAMAIIFWPVAPDPQATQPDSPVHLATSDEAWANFRVFMVYWFKVVSGVGLAFWMVSIAVADRQGGRRRK